MKLVLVAGPSGAGKDSVIRGAAALLKDDPRFYFARRMVTRDHPQPGELPVSTETFDHLMASGHFAITWQAHQLSYGLPREELKPSHPAVQILIANVSRTVVHELLAEHEGHVLYITASSTEIRRRLEKRHRESPASIQERIQRSVVLPEHLPMTTIHNNARLEEAVSQSVRVLKNLLEAR